MRCGSLPRPQPAPGCPTRDDRIDQMTDKSSEVATQRTARRMAGALTVTGVIHLVRPQIYDSLIPSVMPGPARAWSVGSGFVELAVAGLLTAPATRKVGGVAAAGLFVALWPSHFKMIKDWSHKPMRKQAVAWARLPLQIPMIRSALRVARG